MNVAEGCADSVDRVDGDTDLAEVWAPQVDKVLDLEVEDLPCSLSCRMKEPEMQ